MNEERPNGTEETPRRMSKEEAKDFRGVTLTEDGREERGEEEREIPHGFQFRILTPSQLPWWKKAIYIGIAAAFLVAFLMVAWFFLLGGLVIAGAAMVVYFIKKYILK